MIIRALLSANTFFAQASDFITAKYPELLAIITSTGFVLFLIKLLGGFIVAKIKAKVNKPLVDRLAEINIKIDTTLDAVEERFNKSLQEYNEKMKALMAQTLDNYKKTKQKLYKKIVEANEQVEQVIKESKEEAEKIKAEIKDEVDEEAKVEQVTDQVENQVENEPLNEPESLKQPTKTIVVAKRTISNDE